MPYSHISGLGMKAGNIFIEIHEPNMFDESPHLLLSSNPIVEVRVKAKL